MPRISVIVPVYKVEPYLRRCVDSILAQTFADFELILVDDGSPDNCGTICDEYAAQDSRISVIHQTNGGLSAARNAGIDWAFANSDSQWLTFIDSDDWVHEEYLSALYRAADQLGCNISMCMFTRDMDALTPAAELAEPQIWTPEEALSLKHTEACVSYAWGRLYRKSYFEDIRYPVGKLFEDVFTTYKLLFKERNIAVVESKLYYYFDNPQGIVNSRWSPSRMDIIYAREELLSFLKENGYTWLYENNYRTYAYSLSLQCRAIRGEKEYHLYWKQIHTRLCNALRERPDLFSMEKTPWAFEAAYPMRARCYWTWRGITGKLKQPAKHNETV